MPTKYGFAGPVDTYMAGTWALVPHTVLAWTEFPEDATRYRFP